jgi:propanol-preferring alcohol dehydrogenase
MAGRWRDEMLGHRIHAWGQEPVLEEMPEPTPGADEVAIDVEACGVGLTVLNCINGDLADDRATLPRVPGHELVGRVTAQGSDVAADLVGLRVTAYFYLICGTCEACLSDREPLCERLGGLVGVHRDGGYAPRVVLPAQNAVVIPDSLDPVEATVVPDAIATPVHIAGRSEIGDGDRVVVIGAAGGVGIHMVQVAAHRGARVVGLDVAGKLAAIEDLGIPAADSSDFTTLEAGNLFDDGPPTVIVDLIGTADSTNWSLTSLANRGRLVVLTTFRDQPLQFESRDLVFRESTVIGSRYASRAQVAEAAELLASGAVKPIIGLVRPAEGVGVIHDQLRAGTLRGRGAITWSHA